MPSTLTTFADSEIRMRFKEPFLTEGLNAKLAVNQPRGIYRGFRLGTNVAALTITITADSVGLDHVTVYQTSTGRSLSLRKEGGNFGASLAAYASKTVVIAIYATYVLGSDTAAEIRIYELLPADEFTGAAENAELVVLGRVVVPAAGLIPAANITHQTRTSAWHNEAIEASPWLPLLRNPSFEWSGPTGASVGNTLPNFNIPFWEITDNDTALGKFERDALGTSRTGKLCLKYNYLAGSATSTLRQWLHLPTYVGQMVVVRFYIRKLKIAASGTLTINLFFSDGSTGGGLWTESLTIDMSATTADFVEVHKEFVLPVSTQPWALGYISLVVGGMNFGSAGDAFRIDDFQAWAEVADPRTLYLRDARMQEVSAYPLVLEDPASPFGTGGSSAAVLRYLATAPAGEGTLFVERRNKGAGLDPAIDFRGRLLGLGQGLVANETDALKSRITSPYGVVAGIDYTLLWESGPISGTVSVLRIYVASSGHLWITVNARWGSPTANSWNKDASTAKALALQFGDSSLPTSSVSALLNVLARDPALTSAWTNPNWSSFMGLNAFSNPTAYSAILATFDALSLNGANRGALTPAISANIVLQSRVNVVDLNGGDAVAASQWGPYGEIFHSGDVLQEDFWNELGQGFVRQDIVGVGSHAFINGSLVQLSSGAVGGNNSVIRAGLDGNWNTAGGSRDLCFRHYVSISDVTNCEVRLGFWESALGNPDVDANVNGFKIIDGVVSVIVSGQAPVSTGVTLAASSKRWFTMIWDPLNLILQWHIGVGNAGAHNMLSGTYGSFALLDFGQSNDMYPFVGVKTGAASAATVVIDYISAWSSVRNLT